MSERLSNNLSRVDLRQMGWNLNVEIDGDRNVRSVIIDGNKIEISQDRFEPLVSRERGKTTVIKDFSTHPMNLGIRHGDMTDPSLIDSNQDRILVMRNDEGTISGLVIPKILSEREVLAKVDLLQTPHSNIPFSIELFDFSDKGTNKVTVKPPGAEAKILHTTQILGHVKDACDMQMFAHRRGTLVRNWNFGFPPTTKRSENQKDLTIKGVPTKRVTFSWTYGPESEELPSDFRKQESLETILGFLAANSGIAKQVAEGKFKVVSTNFKQEGNLLKLINPGIILTGINFTFLSGRPGDRLRNHNDSPKLVRMLQRVQRSLDNAPRVLENLVGSKVEVADWWRLTEEKLLNVQTLLYRTFSFDTTLPKKIGNTDIIQIPHPVPEIRLNKSESRKHISGIINKEIDQNTKIVLLPGSSEDGLFQERLTQVCDFVTDKGDVIVLMPLKPDDPRIAGKALPRNVFPIGYRGDWMDILPGADATFIRGSWGELLDIVAAGITPIIMSPGTVPETGDPGFIQFLTEVSGERATNVSLFLDELKKQGASSDVVNGLLADIVDPKLNGEIENALAFALKPEVSDSVKSALSKIKKDGISWMVIIHELLLANGRTPTREEIGRLHKKIWNY